MSLLLVARMLNEADDRPAAAAVLKVARRRFPRDYWICMMDGTLNLQGAPKPDPAEAARSFAAAMALEPRSVAAHTNLAIALHREGKLDEASERAGRGKTAQAQDGRCSTELWVTRSKKPGRSMKRLLRTARRSGSSRAMSRVTRTSAMSYHAEETTTRPSPLFARRSGSRRTRIFISTWPLICKRRENWTRQSRLTERRSNSSTTPSMPTTTWARPCSSRARRKRRKQNLPWRDGSNRMIRLRS